MSDRTGIATWSLMDTALLYTFPSHSHLLRCYVVTYWSWNDVTDQFLMSRSSDCPFCAWPWLSWLELKPV